MYEVPGQGSWLKVPLGELDTERMVPLDEETLVLLDRVTATRTSGRPVRHPRTGRPAQFLFTHHRRRLSQNALRAELNRAAALEHVTPHQLRHTYATALVNAGVSPQALMALLGHVSAEMSLRYVQLFNTTVRTEYERALDLAKSRIGPLPAGRPGLPLLEATRTVGHWRDTPTIKARLAGGYCLRAPAREACPYANICEHCPSFSHRHRLPARARRATRRHRSTRHRRTSPRLDRRSRPTPATARPPRHPHRPDPGPDRMKRTAPLDRVEQACAALANTGEPITFTAIADHTGLAAQPSTANCSCARSSTNTGPGAAKPERRTGIRESQSERSLPLAACRGPAFAAALPPANNVRWRMHLPR